MVAPDMGGMNYPAYIKTFTECGVKVTLFERLRAVKRQGNKLAAVLYNQYAKTTAERIVDQVVVEHGTIPADELYFALKPQSRHLGEVDYAAFAAVRPQTLDRKSVVQGKRGSVRVDLGGGGIIKKKMYEIV